MQATLVLFLLVAVAGCMGASGIDAGPAQEVHHEAAPGVVLTGAIRVVDGEVHVDGMVQNMGDRTWHIVEGCDTAPSPWSFGVLRDGASQPQGVREVCACICSSAVAFGPGAKLARTFVWQPGDDARGAYDWRLRVLLYDAPFDVYGEERPRHVEMEARAPFFIH